jgi:circadian clock protein KaiB
MNDQPAAGQIVLRLYVAGEAPNSIRAIANLKSLVSDLRDECDLEVVDVLEKPLKALKAGVMLTPTLVKLAPPPTWTMVGDLSDTAKVRAALGIEGTV